MKIYCFLHLRPMPHLSFVSLSNWLNEILIQRKNLGIYCTQISVLIFIANTWVHSDLFFHYSFNDWYVVSFPSQTSSTQNIRDRGGLDLLVQFSGNPMFCTCHGLDSEPRERRFDVQHHNTLCSAWHNSSADKVGITVSDDRRKPSPSGEN